MSRFAILLLALSTTSAFAQQTPQSSQPQQEENNTQSQNTLTSLAGQFFHGDFVNFYATGSGVYDANAAIVGGPGGSGTGGFALGGGVQAYHRFRTSILSLSYNLNYTDYHSGGYASGISQYLSLLYSKQLSRRWNLGFVESAGMYRYGIGYYGQPNAATPAVANPFSPVSKTASSAISLSYRQSARLTYDFGGDFFLSRYSYPGAIGTTGISGSGSLVYRITGRTTIGGTYSHSYYSYQRSAGQAVLDGGYFNLTHQFADLWTATVSAGLTRSDSSGIIRVPVSVILNGQQVTGYAVGPYKLDRVTPSIQGSVSHRLQRVVITGSVGQVVSPGNGIYLASRNRFFSGTASYSRQRSNISVSGGYFHLTSLANSISTSYGTGNFGASYGYTLTRHLSANVRYDYFRYGNVYAFGAVSDNRLLFSLSFSSKSIPLTLY